MNALASNTSGHYNTGIGYNALSSNSTGGYNVAVGFQAGLNVNSGRNIDIANTGTNSDTSVTRIGPNGVHMSFFSAGIAGAMVSNQASVLIDTTTGQLRTVSSSRRYKEDIQDMNDASSGLLRLRPVTFRCQRLYGSKPIDYGLIAEEVAEVYPDLVVKGADGQIETVQYHKLIPMLLNELQKERREQHIQDGTIQSLTLLLYRGLFSVLPARRKLCCSPVSSSMRSGYTRLHSSSKTSAASSNEIPSPEEYLKSERTAEFRSEYYQGHVYRIDDVSVAHGTILANLCMEFGMALREGPCRVMTGVLLPTSQDGLYTYPDLMAVCGEPKSVDDQRDTVLNPVLIVEVLSPSTEGHDRGFKFSQYRKVDSLREYAMVWQAEPHIEKYVRQSSGEWLLSEVMGLDAVSRFESVGRQVALSGVYAGVSFPAAGSNSGAEEGT